MFRIKAGHFLKSLTDLMSKVRLPFACLQAALSKLTVGVLQRGFDALLPPANCMKVSGSGRLVPGTRRQSRTTEIGEIARLSAKRPLDPVAQ